MKKNHIQLLIGVLATLSLAACGEPDYANGPEAWQKTPVADKIERIKKMPLSQAQKIQGINELPISQEEKDKAIAEIKAQGQSPTG